MGLYITKVHSILLIVAYLHRFGPVSVLSSVRRRHKSKIVALPFFQLSLILAFEGNLLMIQLSTINGNEE